MTSGDRETTYQQRVRYRTELEMRRGAEIVEQNINSQCQVIARDALSEAFNPDHTPHPDGPNGQISVRERKLRNEYRNRMGAQVDKS